MGIHPDLLDAVRGTSVIELVSRLGIPRRGSRYFCPTCQPDGPDRHKTPDLSITDGIGFHCFKCGIEGGDGIDFIQITEGLSFTDAVHRVAELTGLLYKGYPDEEKYGHSSKQQNQGRTAPSQDFLSPKKGILRTATQKPVTGLLGGGVQIPETPQPQPNLIPVLEDLIGALPGSPGEEYLQQRGFSLELAQCRSIGYASPSVCRSVGLDKGMAPKLGRVIFYHDCPTGVNAHDQVTTELCSLYGRAVELTGKPVDQALRHRHLSRPRGWFNCAAVSAVGFPEPLIVCEGAFDALAWIAAGHQRTLATYGAHVNRIEWFRGARQVLVALDVDPTGQRKSKELARELHHRGKTVFLLSSDDLQGAKDAAEAWARGTLSLDLLRT